MVISICAVVALADGPTAIAHWAKLNERWLRRHLSLPNGIPRKDTFRRVLTLLDPILFQKCFSEWLNSVNIASDDHRSTKIQHIASDGKALRRSHHQKANLGPLNWVSAWASGTGITFGQVATDQKSNEITAIPQLLELIDIEDTVITIDAAGGQRVGSVVGETQRTIIASRCSPLHCNPLFVGFGRCAWWCNALDFGHLVHKEMIP